MSPSDLINAAFALPDIRLRRDCTRSSTMSICSWPAETLSAFLCSTATTTGAQRYPLIVEAVTCSRCGAASSIGDCNVTSLAVFERLRSPLTFREQTRRKLIE
jgi:hypothetical protein